MLFHLLLKFLRINRERRQKERKIFLSTLYNEKITEEKLGDFFV